MSLTKPRSVASSPFRSSKWDELVDGREFTQADAPTLALLCMWYEVVETCIDDITIGGEVRVAYSNDIGDVRALPQLQTMKGASAEIRALNKQLGIDDEAKPAKEKAKVTPLHVIQSNRQARAANSRGA